MASTMSTVLEEIVNYLKDKYDVKVSTEVPSTRPKRLITVSRVGGGGNVYLSTPRIDIDAWGLSDVDAYCMLESITEDMLALPGNSSLISNVEKTTMYRSDIDGAHRWTASFEITRNR